ncbi:MAG: universal stress protein [Actinomycetota bacterium]|nr:universal stress protein [Actinomycetota bacterium]
MPGIVVGIDGSTGSHPALRWAAKEAADRHAPLTVLTVHQTAVSFWTGSSAINPADKSMEETEQKLLEEATLKVTSQLDSQPASVTVKTASGGIAHELISAAKDADLLVVGTRGGGGFGSLRLGSVSSQVVGHAPCPVVVVPS